MTTVASRGRQSAPRGSRMELLEGRQLYSASLDTTFDTDGRTSFDMNTALDFATRVAEDANGNYLVAGNVGKVTGQSGAASGYGIARLTTGGALDTTFNSSGKLNDFYRNRGPQGVSGIFPQSGGGFYVAGWSQSSSALVRAGYAAREYSSSGSVSGTAVSIESVSDVFDSVDSVWVDGGIVVVGHWVTSPLSLAATRITSGLSVDTSWGASGWTSTPGATPSAVQTRAGAAAAWTSDSVLVAASDYPVSLDDADPGTLAFYSISSSGGVSGASFDPIYNVYRPSDMLVTSGGKVVVATSQYDAMTDTIYRIVARFNSNGSLDTTFDGDGIADISDLDGSLNITLAEQSDGKLVILGDTSSNGVGVIRMTTGGARDSSFATSGLFTFAFPGSGTSSAGSVIVDSDDRIVVSGQAPGGDFGVARIVDASPRPAPQRVILPTGIGMISACAMTDNEMFSSTRISNVWKDLADALAEVN